MLFYLHLLYQMFGFLKKKFLKTQKMADMKNMTQGEMRLLFIHTRVQYLWLNYLDEENMHEFRYKPLCDCCEMKLDMSGGKRGNELEVTPSCKALFVQCSGVGWLCRARQRLKKK